MKSLLLSTLCFLLLSNTYSYCSDATPKKSGWNFPIATAVSSVLGFKKAPTANNATASIAFDDATCVAVDLQPKTTPQQNSIITPPILIIEPQAEKITVAVISLKKTISDQNLHNNSRPITPAAINSTFDEIIEAPVNSYSSPSHPGLDQASLKSSRNNSPDSIKSDEVYQIELYNFANRTKSSAIKTHPNRLLSAITPTSLSRSNSQKSISSTTSSQDNMDIKQTDNFNPGSASLSRSNSYRTLADISNLHEISDTQPLLTTQNLQRSVSLGSINSNESGDSAESKKEDNIDPAYYAYLACCLPYIKRIEKSLSESKLDNSSSSIKKQVMHRSINKEDNKKKVE